MARLALSVLSPAEENADSLGDQLSWFIEVIGFLGLDERCAVQMMDEWFSYKT
jgi:hypothetical protein